MKQWEPHHQDPAGGQDLGLKTTVETPGMLCREAHLDLRFCSLEMESRLEWGLARGSAIIQDRMGGPS